MAEAEKVKDEEMMTLLSGHVIPKSAFFAIHNSGKKKALAALGEERRIEINVKGQKVSLDLSNKEHVRKFLTSVIKENMRLNELVEAADKSVAATKEFARKAITEKLDGLRAQLAKSEEENAHLRREIAAAKQAHKAAVAQTLELTRETVEKPRFKVATFSPKSLPANTLITDINGVQYVRAREIVVDVLNRRGLKLHYGNILNLFRQDKRFRSAIRRHWVEGRRGRGLFLPISLVGALVTFTNQCCDRSYKAAA